jgi:hypothetical protein
MGRAIEVDNKLDKHEKRIFKLEGAVTEMIDILENIRANMKIVEKNQKKRSADVKKKANNKRTK